MSARFKAPSGLTGGISVGGEFLTIDDKGCVTVPDGFDAAMLSGAGFVAAPAEAAAVAVAHVEGHAE